MIRNLSRVALLSTAVVLTSLRLAGATPVQPSAPVAGWIYDETYNGFGSTIKDSFGSMNGLTAGATNGTEPNPGGPTTSTDTPFVYGGNSSFSTLGGPGSGNIWFGNFGVGKYAALASGTTAVTVSAWLKYEEGALTAVGTNNQNNNANGFFAMNLHDPAGGSGIYLNLPTGTTASVSNKDKLLVGGTSISTDLFQSYITSTKLNPGQWNHIVAVLDFAGDQIRVSINNGAFETANVAFGSNTLTPGTLVTIPDIIPTRSANSEFIGLLDEVAIWTTALNADNVEWLQNNSLYTIPEPGSILLAGFGCTLLLGLCRFGRGKAIVNRAR